MPEQSDNQDGQDAHETPDAKQAAGEPLDEELANARLMCDGLPSALKANAGAALTEPLLGAIALVHAKDPAEWARVKATLMKARGSVNDVKLAIQNRSRKLRLVTPEEVPARTTAGSALGESCPAPDLVIPEGFALRPGATTKMIPDRGDHNEKSEREEVIAHAPVLIAARLRDIDVGTESLDLCFRRSDSWQHLIVDRSVALDGRKIVQLASNGFPVASTTAAHLVEYLNKLEGINFHRIPTIHSTSHLGWQGKAGELGFLCGRKLILPGSDLVLPESPQIADSSPMVFVGSSHGDEQIADSIYTRGSREGWLEAISVLARFPRVRLGLYASFVPPLLRILERPTSSLTGGIGLLPERPPYSAWLQACGEIPMSRRRNRLCNVGKQHPCLSSAPVQ